MSQLVHSDLQPYKLHDTDTGSSDVQIVRITDRIQHLTQHLSLFAKDHSSRRTLLKLVVRRRKLLDYLRSESEERYQRVIKGLGLRK